MIEFSKNTEMSVRNSTQPDFKVPQLKKEQNFFKPVLLCDS